MSEFGKGLTYCLGLFLAHAERMNNARYLYSEESKYSIWFSGASDHLYELQIPESIPNCLQKRLKKFKDKCLSLRLQATKENFEWAIQEAKNLLMMIDKFHGIKTKKGVYE